MITDKKVETHIKFEGDVDMWQRAASEKDMNCFPNNEWHEVSLIQSELIQLDNVSVSQKYKEEIQERLAATKCSQSALNKLKADK